MFCHTTERPAFSLGIGDFVAVDHLGNFDINDTIIQKVNKFHSHVFFSFRSFLKQGGALWSRFLSSFCWVFQLRSWGWSHARFRGRHRKWSFCPQVHFPWKMAPRSWEIQQVINEVAASMDPVWQLWFWQSLWKLCRVWAHLVGEAGEHIYGGGEQYTYLDLKVDDTIMRHVILKITPYRVGTIQFGWGSRVWEGTRAVR